MKLGMIGLGRMGMNMTRRLIKGGHNVVVWNRSLQKVRLMQQEGAIGATSIAELVKKLEKPRIVWIMLPAGKPVEDTISELKELLSAGDIIIEGGNSFYEDDIRRAEELKNMGIHYIDAGVSGGIWGLEIGYCLMLGGEKEIYDRIEPILKALAPEDGYMYCGPHGAGHFVKMVHNGIEYAMLEAYGEGFELLKTSPYSNYLNFGSLAHLWNRGSVIRSWLLELLEEAFKKEEALESIRGFVEDSGEARWTVQKAVEFGVSVPVIAISLFKRFQSRNVDLFSDKVVAALRREFGGHKIKTKDKK